MTYPTNNQPKIKGVISFEYKKIYDFRGSFTEIFSQNLFQNNGIEFFNLNQINLSVSKKNVFRGIHFSIAPEGQNKIVTCIDGSISDFVIDLRVGSPTFGKFDRFELNSTERKMIYVPSGCGHGFLANSGSNTVLYAQTSRYSPKEEFSLNCFDRELNLNLQKSEQIILSKRDESAPYLSDLIKMQILPKYIPSQLK